MADITRCFECGGDFPVDVFEDHACTDPRNGPYDLGRDDYWYDDEDDERDT